MALEHEAHILPASLWPGSKSFCRTEGRALHFWLIGNVQRLSLHPSTVALIGKVVLISFNDRKNDSGFIFKEEQWSSRESGLSIAEGSCGTRRVGDRAVHSAGRALAGPLRTEMEPFAQSWFCDWAAG